MKIEGVFKKVKFDLREFVSNPSLIMKGLEDIEDWVITDFDGYLKGNPHI